MAGTARMVSGAAIAAIAASAAFSGAIVDAHVRDVSVFDNFWPPPAGSPWK
jgi:hypothetical protein